MNDLIEKRIKQEELRFIKDNNRSAQYLLMSIEGYNELLHDVAVKHESGNIFDENEEGYSSEDSFYLQELNNYKGLTIYVSQDLESPDFILA